MRRLLLFFVCVLTSIGMSADYIEWNQTTGVWDVYVTSDGSFTNLWNNLNEKGENDVFHFVNGCSGFIANELAMISGNDGGGKYYIDLYDLTPTPELESVISQAVSQMVNSSRRCKGLLLPKNPTTVGTMLICNGSENVNKGQYSCGQFIAYQNGTTTMIHIYAYDAQNHKTDAVMEGYLTNLENIMAHHSDIAGETTTYSVSTNKATPLTNVSSVKGNKTGVTVVHTYNNELVNNTATKPTVIITPGHDNGGDFASAVEATGMAETPNIEKLKFVGNVNADDIRAINNFTKNGPKVVDLSEVPTSTITKDLLNNLENGAIEYIILPAGMDETVVCDYTKLENLKCVISSNKSNDTQHNLTAYVRTAGSLAQARYWATGGEAVDNNTKFKPQSQNLTSVKLMGELNIDDISVGDSKGLQSENNSITTIDLEDAHFATVSDMNLSQGAAGFGSNVTEVKLPKNMTEIPANCLYQLSGLTSLHIPYSYTKIGEQAFYGTNISHITTEDANGGLIDNGENTYSLSANIQVLGTLNQGNSVFPNKESVTDVYCLATKAPLCYTNTFPTAKVYNNGGLEGDNVPYCREKYKQGNAWTAVLHFPSQETFDNETDASKKDGSYDEMRNNYTDPTRKYTKKDQTGAVDANGNHLLWPDQQEQLQSHDNQAVKGYTWDQFEPIYDPGDGHMSGMNQIDNTKRPFDGKYNGWHQFVLANATYFEPAQKVEGDKIIEEYQEAGWFTICLPYDLTEEQVINWLGVPKSHDNVICKLYKKDGTLDKDNVSDPIMPDAHQLWTVERLKAGAKDSQGKTYNKNMVYLRFTTNLLSTNEYKYLDFNHENDPGNVIETTTTQTEGTGSSKICLKGGRPYIVKAYKRLNEIIKSQNIGRRIMTHHADELHAANSCMKNADTREWLGDGTLETLKFAKPYEKHKVQAFNGNAKVSDYMTYNDGEKDKKYYYTMIGQFWDQPLPMYCFYMSHGIWYRNLSDQYTWQAYKCVIIPTVEVEGGKGEGYRDDSRSNYPNIVSGSKDLLDSELKIGFADGRNDDDFENYQQAKYVFMFDDEGIFEFDENGEMVTAIDNLDGEDMTVAKSGGKVYNMSGQYVGTSLNGLAKGMYIVNGKKIVVK